MGIRGRPRLLIRVEWWVWQQDNNEEKRHDKQYATIPAPGTEMHVALISRQSQIDFEYAKKNCVYWRSYKLELSLA